MTLLDFATGRVPLTLVEVALSVLVALALVSFAQPLGEWLGVMDRPGGEDNHKRHARPVPAVGGVIMAVCAGMVIAVDIPLTTLPRSYTPLQNVIICAAITGMMLLGLADDRRHLPAVTRLGISAAVYGLLILSVPNLILDTLSMSALGLNVHFGIFAIPFTLLCLIALQNAVNMADGRNGLLLGLYIMWMALYFEHAPPALRGVLLSLIATGVVLFAANCAGRLFMGDCGSYGVASFAGVTALNLYSTSTVSDNPLSSGEIILMFIVPGVDMIRLMFTRMLSGRSPFAADHRHLHHLLDAQFGWRRGWFVYMALVGVPLWAVHLNPAGVVWFIGASLAAYSGLVAWLPGPAWRGAVGDVVRRN